MYPMVGESPIHPMKPRWHRRSPGDHCEIHHSPDWTPHGATNADKLFFACGPDHKLITDGHFCAAGLTC